MEILRASFRACTNRISGANPKNQEVCAETCLAWQVGIVSLAFPSRCADPPLRNAV